MSNMTVYRLISAGESPRVRIGRSYRLREEDVDAYLAARYTRPADPGPHGRTRPATSLRSRRDGAPLRDVSFLSDYGHADEFVGVCKSVIRSIARDVASSTSPTRCPPHDVRAGARSPWPRGAVPRRRASCSPSWTPAWAPSRRAVAVEVGETASLLVGPDNGLLAPAVAMAAAPPGRSSSTNPEYQLRGARARPSPGGTSSPPPPPTSATGVPLAELGDPRSTPSAGARALLPLARRGDGAVVGRGAVGRPLRQLPAQRRPGRARRPSAIGCRLRIERGADGHVGSPPSPTSAPGQIGLRGRLLRSGRDRQRPGIGGRGAGWTGIGVRLERRHRRRTRHVGTGPPAC